MAQGLTPQQKKGQNYTKLAKKIQKRIAPMENQRMRAIPSNIGRICAAVG
jgi:hypothetical protein